MESSSYRYRIFRYVDPAAPFQEKELGQELFNLRFQKATGQLSNTAAVGKIKKDLAKVKTVIQEIEMKGDPNRG